MQNHKNSTFFVAINIPNPTTVYMYFVLFVLFIQHTQGETVPFSKLNGNLMVWKGD